MQPHALAIGPMIPLPEPAIALHPPTAVVLILARIASAPAERAIGSQLQRARIPVDRVVEQRGAGERAAERAAGQRRAGLLAQRARAELRIGADDACELLHA